MSLSVATGTPTTPAAHALDLLILLQLLARHSTDACAVEVGLLGLDAAKTTQLYTICQRIDMFIHN